jgi:hypothetical protein
MRRLGEQARKEYEAKYTAAANYRRLIEIYRQVIAERIPAVESEAVGIQIPEQAPPA